MTFEWQLLDEQSSDYVADQDVAIWQAAVGKEALATDDETWGAMVAVVWCLLAAAATIVSASIWVLWRLL